MCIKCCYAFGCEKSPFEKIYSKPTTLALLAKLVGLHVVEKNLIIAAIHEEQESFSGNKCFSIFNEEKESAQTKITCASYASA